MQNNQEEWTKILRNIFENELDSLNFIQENYSDGSNSYSIKKEEIEFWVTSSNMEFSIGFNDQKNNCTWHAHMRSFGANTIEEQKKELLIQINNIIKNKIRIAYSEKDGYWMPGKSEEINDKNDGKIEYKFWKEV